MEIKPENNNTLIRRCLLVGLISFLAFIVLDDILTLAVFEAVSIFVFSIILTTYDYKRKENEVFYKTLLSCFIVIAVMYSVYRFFFKHDVVFEKRSVMIVLKYLFFVFMIALSMIVLLRTNKKNIEFENINEGIRLMPGQLFDKERLLSLLENENIIGLNSQWGSGKTTIINDIIKQQKNWNYETVVINLLSINIDDLQEILISSISSILLKHRVYSSETDRLKSILSGTTFFNYLKPLLQCDNRTFSETLCDLKKQLAQFEKTIVIVYEDLDRVCDPAKVKAILDISWYLSSDKIKVIFQYDEAKMKLVDKGIDYEYLEKYIPLTMRLTSIPVRDSIHHLIETDPEKFSGITLEDFRFLDAAVLGKDVEVLLGGTELFFPTDFDVPFRKILQYLDEACQMLKLQPQLNDNKKLLLVVLYIKHFRHPIYERFNEFENIIDAFEFCKTTEDPIVSERFSEVIYKRNSFGKMAAIEECGHYKSGSEGIAEYLAATNRELNHESIALILSLGYDLNTEGYSFRDPLTESTIKAQKTFENNEKIDHLIWCILSAGREPMTSSECFVEKFETEVLCKPECDQKEAYLNLCYKYYNGNISDRLGAKTIFRFGEKPEKAIFRSYCLANATPTQWTKLIEFSFTHFQLDEVTPELIECLLYVPVFKNEKLLFLVIEKFNQLKPTGNMNNDKSYALFLERYLRTLSERDFLKESVRWQITQDDETINKQLCIEVLADEIKQLDSVKTSYVEMPSVYHDLEKVKGFLLSNIGIIQNEKKCGRSSLHVKCQMESRLINQDEYDRLKSIQQNNSGNFHAEVNNSYESGKIFYSEVKKLCEKY